MIVFHIDVNNAFLSWESLYRITQEHEELDLRTIPSAIAGDAEHRHGIILAKSPPAKKFGIKTAETIASALKKCPNLTLVPPRIHIYRDYSQKLMELFQTYTDNVEQYSIDEAFLDMTGTKRLWGEPEDAAIRLKTDIYERFGFTVNIGISTNKLLAKMASDFEKPDKIHTLYPDEIPVKMWPLPVSELFFVGKSTVAKLYTLGIRTIGDLANADISAIRSHLGKHGTMIYDYARGIDSSPICRYEPDNKGYGKQITLSHDVTDANEAKQVLLTLCESVGARLRADHMAAGVVGVQIRDLHFSNGSKRCTLPSATNVTNELYEYASMLFDAYWDGTPIRLLCVSTSQVTSDTNRQLNLFDGDRYLREEHLDAAVDDIRDRFGKDAIVRASLIQTDR